MSVFFPFDLPLNRQAEPVLSLLFLGSPSAGQKSQISRYHGL